MPKQTPTPETVLKSFMDEYQLTPLALSKSINLPTATIQKILKGKAQITACTALRFAKFFGQTPAYWLDLQRDTDLAEAAKDTELSAILKTITKAKKPKPQPAAKTKPQTPTKTLADKRKADAKIPGSKPAKGKDKK